MQGYGDEYNDYNMEDDGMRVSGCYQGTDCTDCGGVDAIVDYSKVILKELLHLDDFHRSFGRSIRFNSSVPIDRTNSHPRGIYYLRPQSQEVE